MKKLKILLKKVFFMRKNYKYVLLLEALLPVAVIFFIALKKARDEKSCVLPTTTVADTDFKLELNRINIKYSPMGEDTGMFIKQLENRFKSVDGYRNQNEMNKARQNTSNKYASIRVNFNTPLMGESKIKYTLRTVENSYTETKDEEESLIIATTQFAINEGVIFLNGNGGNKTPWLLEMGSFPHPGHKMGSDVSLMWVCLFVILSSTMSSGFLINDMIVEKNSNVEELLRICGLDKWMIWTGWFVRAVMINIITFPIATWIVVHPFNGKDSEIFHVITYSIVVTFVILYSVANIAWCFVISSLFNEAKNALQGYYISSSTILSLMCVIDWLQPNDVTALKLFIPHPVGAFFIGIRQLLQQEKYGFEISTTTIIDDFSEMNYENNFTFIVGILMLQIFSYTFLAVYIFPIKSGKFDFGKSPLFICESAAPSKSKSTSTIHINALYKQFGSVRAVNGVNLNIYRGEITALLGRNDAGKTTIMSIMTGLTSPSSGSIYFRGMDIFENMNDFRRSLGMCPQENRTIPYLSVLDHLLFFGQLKGVSMRDANIEAKEYLTIMDMESKKNSLVSELSSGMKRKLCLSIALMGKPEVLILDEPTSGIDVQCRRKIWDLLLRLRGERTIIFTTHCMEEADMFSDRIAIMDHGVIVSHGTPMSLKKAHGTGYELTITKSKEHLRGVDQIIRDVLPSASVEFESSTEVVYKLPFTETSKFPTLFKKLESKKSALGIKEMGVAATTMEHVFLKVCGISVHDTTSTNNTSSAYTNGELTHIDYVKNTSLIIQGIETLWKKKMRFILRNPFDIILKVIFPILVGRFLLDCIINPNLDRYLRSSVDLSMASYPGSVVIIRNNGDASNFEKYLREYIAEKGGTVINSEDSNITIELLKHSRNIDAYNQRYITAFEWNSTSMKILYNPKIKHSFSISVTTYSNVLLRTTTGSSSCQIETFNEPLQKPGSIQRRIGNKDAHENLSFYIKRFFAMKLCTTELTSYVSSLVSTERIVGFYHIQMMSNLSPLLYWTSTLVLDLLLFFIFVIIRCVFFFKAVDNSDFLGFDTSLGVLIFITIFYGIGDILFIYVNDYLSSAKIRSVSSSQTYMLISSLFVWWQYNSVNLGIYENWFSFIKMPFDLSKWVILLVPSLNYSSLFINLMVIYKNNDDIKNERLSYLEFPSEENPNGLMLGITFLLIDIVLYSLILYLINAEYVRYWINEAKNMLYGTETTNHDRGNEDVQQEFYEVQQYKNNTSRNSRIALLVDGLRKKYLIRFKPFTAVSKVGFAVKPGECFGLLGVNGAGKSTTLKMLAGETLPTLGDSSLEGIKLRNNKIRYLSMAGYCSERNCFIDVFTGREMLIMIAALRGVPSSENQTLVSRWIGIMGLEEIQNERCGTYSGGNGRKLCTAMSLIGDPRVVFLDEPTSGVDPVSRRKLYDVMRQSKKAGQTVILTSHNMEECETLCDRVTIMKAGVMKRIGTTHRLKKMYAQGFSVMIQLINFNAEVMELKNSMSEIFTEGAGNCNLKVEREGLLYYQIKDTTLSWSVLFEKMEHVKSSYPALVEDYVLTDTTLEEGFMSFAKENDSFYSVRL